MRLTTAAFLREKINHTLPGLEKIPALLDAGATLLGGCCGTTDAHIAAIRDAIRAYSANAGK